MTNKEAKEKLYMEWQKFLEENIDYAGISEAYKMAFKALEQEPMTDVLDKIRAEIEEQVLESLSDGGDDWFAAEKVNECLDIIDKYKAESEDKE